ncbi:hypothetical protein J5N97_029208 [Dioscorea zingiberensis]|uniref:F-box associated beta-propeller type 1 domain-containing protein n=1 Tax=Dioscorea zingiberensis TaxID=325984 RepID=A0A9D5BZU8_9LILI|nr:hypothetical protein J5N97_029208 [Dioscorea zingiberensis]
MSFGRPIEAKDSAHPFQSASMSSKLPKDALLLQSSNPIYLHEDILLEILSWLPAKTIRRLTFLRKDLSHLYTDHLLQRLQTQRVRTTSSGFFLQGYHLFPCKEFFFDNSSGVPTESLEFIFKNSKNIVASSGGLIVFENNGNNKSLQGDFCVFNPVLQTFAPIFYPPDILLDIPHIGAICMSSDDGEEYEMILVTTKWDMWKTILECRRYSSRDMSWEYLKTIDDSGQRNINLENPIFVNGSVYWASDTGSYMRNVDSYILAFDVEKRSSELVPLPKEVRNMEADSYTIQIAPWVDGALCLIQYIKLKGMVIWVMESPPSQISWRKIHEVDMMTLGLINEQQSVGSYIVINSELLVFTIEDWVYSYCLKDGHVNQLGEYNLSRYPKLRPYANTFHPCGRLEVKNGVENFI